MIYFFVIFLLIGFLLVNPSGAAAASASGLMLWFKSLVPTLLPFLILSNLLISMDGISCITRVLYPFFHRIFGCSPEGCYAIATGFLCGYPVGAKITADLVREHRISLEEGSYLLCFCNNASPAFLVSFCLTDCLKRPDLLWISLAILYGTPICIALFLRRGRHFQSLSTEKKTSGSQISFKIVDVCMMNGLESILKLGCYIILFSMLARLLMSLPCPFPLVSCAGTGFLEITNGIAVISSDPSVPLLFKYSLILGFSAFGGLSGAAQTESMILSSGLSLLSYVKVKLVTAALVICLASAFILLNP